MGKPSQKCIELGIALLEIFRYIRYQFNELEWNLLMSEDLSLDTLMANKQGKLPGDEESRSCLFLLSRHFSPCQMYLRDIIPVLASQPGIVNLRPRGLVKLTRVWHSAKSQYHKQSLSMKSEQELLNLIYVYSEWENVSWFAT